MTQSLKDKSARLLIVEAGVAVRQTLSDVLREFGFQEIIAVASCKEGLEVLEVEAIDWVLIPLGKDDEAYNALQLLRLSTEVANLRRTRISLFVDDDELTCLPLAFSLGAFSWHRRSFSRTGLHVEIQALFSKLQAYDGNDTLVAASYLRDHLKEQRFYRSLLGLEEGLSKLYPSHVGQMVMLGDALALNGERQEAYRNLQLALLLDHNTQAAVAAVIEQHFTPLRPEEAEPFAHLNLFGLTTCLVVDSDSLVQNATRQFLKAVGVPNVELFSDGEAAAQWCKSAEEPGLVIQEWKLPKLTGPLLIQRVRQCGFGAVPILVISSLLKASDLPLLKEMGVGTVLNKPFDQAGFLRSVFWLLRQNHQPSEHKAIVQKIRSELARGRGQEAQQLLDGVRAHPKLSSSQKLLAEAEFAFGSGRYAQARDYGIEALKLAGDSLPLLNLVGKSLMRLGDFANALRFLERAQELSPMNIERLCQIASVQLELGSTEAAQATMQAASALDSQHADVVAMNCNLALELGDTKQAATLMGQLDSEVGVVSYMNSRAIALSRTGRIAEGLALFQRTLDALPPDRLEAQAAVHYNMGLALVRQGELEPALAAVQKACGHEQAAVFKKAQSLLRRIEASRKTGEKVVIHSQEGPAAKGAALPVEDAAAPAAPAAVPAPGGLKAGELCCFAVYTPGEAHDPRYDQLLAGKIRYNVRKVIGR